MNGTPKALLAATVKYANSIEVFYAGIRGSVYRHVICDALLNLVAENASIAVLIITRGHDVYST